MVILSDCLAERLDEGCIKVANSLVKHIKRRCPSTIVLAYNRIPKDYDAFLRMNKLFLNWRLFSFLRKVDKPVLYIPFSSCTRATVLRLCVLKLFNKKPIYALLVSYNTLDAFFWKLLQWSEAHLITLSQESYAFFREVSGERVVYLKTGVDVKKFCPVSADVRTEIRKKYGIEENAKVLLHVGHLKSGRNISSLLNVNTSFHVVLVVSTLTKNEWDEKLRTELETRSNITIIDTFVANIEEVYQMSDIYFFPVQEKGNCIDIPLSVLEAAACGIPVVTTAYGELKELIGQPGFYKIESFDCVQLNKLLLDAFLWKDSGREGVLAYDWDVAVNNLLDMLQDEKIEK